MAIHYINLKHGSLSSISTELQMENSGLNLLCLSHIPEVFSQVTTGSSGHIHLAVVLVATLRTFPFALVVYNNLAVIATNVTVVGFGVKLSILNVIIYVSYHLSQGVQIVSHVRNLNVGDSTS